MKVLDDFSNIFRRYDLELEATGAAKSISTDPIMQEIAQYVVDGDEEGIVPVVEKGLKDILNTEVIYKKKFILGICLGMQLMTDYSDEGKCEGIGWIKGKTTRFNLDSNKFKVPHMGWNNINVLRNNSILKNIFRLYLSAAASPFTKVCPVRSE